MATALAKRPQTAAPLARRPAQRIVVREVPATPARRRRSAGGGGGQGGILNTGMTGQRALVAYALGAAQRTGNLARIPTFGQIGAEGTVALVAGYMSKGDKSSLAADVALCASIVAVNQLGREGLGETAAPAAAPAAQGVGARDRYKVQGDDD